MNIVRPSIREEPSTGRGGIGQQLMALKPRRSLPPLRQIRRPRKASAATPSNAWAQDPRWTRLAQLATVISGVGTFITAVVAVFVLLSKDMVHENIRLHTESIALVNQKLGLESDRSTLQSANVALRADQQQLAAENSRVSEALGHTRLDQAALQGRIRSLAQDAAAKQAQISTGLKHITELEATAAKLSKSNDDVVAAVRLTSRRFLVTSMASEINAYKPAMGELANSGRYDYLIKGDDPAFASAAGTPNAYLFLAAPVADLTPDDVRMSCPIDQGARLLGFRIAGDDHHFKFDVISKTDDPVLVRMCEYLRLGVRMLYPKSRTVQTLNVYNSIKNPSNNLLFIGLTPGSSETLKYEEFRARAFWLPVLSNQLGSQAFDMMDKEQGGAMTRMLKDPRGAPLSYDYDLTELQKTFEATPQDAGMNALIDRFKELDERWVKHLATSSIVVAQKRQKIMDGDSYRPFLKRYDFAELGSPGFYYDRNTVTQYGFKLMCEGLEFGLSNKYLGPIDTFRTEECDLIRRMDEAMMKLPSTQ